MARRWMSKAAWLARKKTVRMTMWIGASLDNASQDMAHDGLDQTFEATRRPNGRNILIPVLPEDRTLILGRITESLEDPEVRKLIESEIGELEGTQFEHVARKMAERAN